MERIGFDIVNNTVAQFKQQSKDGVTLGQIRSQAREYAILGLIGALHRSQDDIELLNFLNDGFKRSLRELDTEKPDYEFRKIILEALCDITSTVIDTATTPPP